MSISEADFYLSPADEEGFRRGYALCRACSKPVMVCVQWDDLRGEVQVMSSGSRPGCENLKCGDRVPCSVDRMATEGDIAFWAAKHAFFRIMDAAVNYDAAMDGIAECDSVDDAKAVADAACSLYRILVEGK